MKELASRYLIIGFLLFVQVKGFAQDIIINEFVSSNNSVLQDIDGDYSDWIEIYNLKDYEIDLSNYSLSDDKDEPAKWLFPGLSIPAHGYLLVFASGKDKYEDNEMHANFKISQSGETLVLSNGQGQVESEIDPVFVPTDQAYARVSFESEVMILTSTPTPMASNVFEEGIYCSHPSGFYEGSFELELFNFDENQQIYYTLNGEVPSLNSTLYSEPILMEDVSQSPYVISGIPTTPLEGEPQLAGFIWKEPESVYKCNTIRFAAFENGIMKGKVHSKTYFVDPEIREHYSFPIISLITDSLNLFDYETGIYIPGKKFDETGFNWWPIGNYHIRGSSWERDAHISYFENQGDLAFETDAGIRMRGYGSASFPQKSMNLYFRSEYGRSNIEYPIFDNSQAEKYKRLILRNSGQDIRYTHFRDAMLQEVMSTMDLEVQEFKPSIVFINGEYWGIYNIREKYDKYYFKYKYGIEEEEINILGICGEVEEGDNQDFMELYGFVEENDLTLEENYSYVSDRLDINNLIDYHIAEIYFANYDWPCNNYKMWKDNDPDSKWRYLIYDLDLSFGYENNSSFWFESMEHAVTSENSWPYCECSNLIFRKLLENEAFREEFLSRFSFHLSNTFCPSRVLSTIQNFESLFTKEIEEHIQRWKYPAKVIDWEYHVDQLVEFAEIRPEYMVNNLLAFFDLEEFDYECSSKPIPVDPVSDFYVYPNPNTGQFYLYNGLEAIDEGDMRLVNSMGEIVYTQRGVSMESESTFYFDISHLSNGFYTLMLESDRETLSCRVIVVSDQ